MSEPAIQAAIVEAYGGPDLALLFRAARDRLERRDLALGGTVTIAPTTPSERRALVRLIGADAAPEGLLRIALADLDTALRRERLGVGLADVLEALGSPLRPRYREAELARAARRAPIDEAREHPVLAAHPELGAWLDWLTSTGVLHRRAPGAERALLDVALTTIALLPADGVLLAVLASDVTGDPHALDRGRPLASVLDRAAAILAGVDPPAGAEQRRAAWAAVGVVFDEVSSRVLVLSLRPLDETWPAPLLRVAAARGAPVVVTLDMLRGVERLEVAERVVRVCEGPVVVSAAAARFGSSAPPLVCTEGEPSIAALRLLAALQAGGARIRYHGDFDPDGLRMAGALFAMGARPWRMEAPDYRLARARRGASDPLGERAFVTPWDPALAEAMAEAGVAVYEEQVLGDLLADLALDISSEEPAPARGIQLALTATGMSKGVRPVVAGVVVAAPMPGRPSGADALFRDDDGSLRLPEDEGWTDWVAASRTRNFLLEDPLLDWLREYGREHGFVPDDEREGYEPRTDFRRFVLGQGLAFEAGVMRCLAERSRVTTIAHSGADSRSRELATATVEAMRGGAELIAQAVLRDPSRRTYGVADLLVRSDVLARLFPDAIPKAEVPIGAPGIGAAHHHYRVVDIKFHSFDLRRDGSLGGGTHATPFAAQTWLYTMAAGRLQGFTPDAAYVLGRTWAQGDERGAGCLERVARVDMDRLFLDRDASLGELVEAAVGWIRTMRREGRDWHVTPVPSRPELYPHMRFAEDAPWHAAKREIGEALRELTLLPRMNPRMRAAAHARGITGWDHPDASAATLGISQDAGAEQCDAVLAANRAPAPVVLPERIALADDSWRDVLPLELFVDFETVSNMADDFTWLPAMGGQALIFQVGCGWRDGDAWRFAQWTADRLAVEAEGAMLDALTAHVTGLAAARGIDLAHARIFHWSPAETATLDTAYNAARTRHPERDWPPDLPWFDLLGSIVRAAPVAVTGTFNFGLKSIAKAMKAASLIETTWGDGPTDGLGAMTAAWRVDAAAATGGGILLDDSLMREVAAYNEVDCRSMAEVLEWLRANR